MVLLALLAPLLTLLSGCIIYDTKCPDCGWDDGDGYDDGDGHDDDDDTAGDDTGDDVVDNAFLLDPSVAAPGESLIASLVAVDPSDYETVAEVEAFGDVVLGATSVRDDEVLLSLTVDADGAGVVDLLVHFTDGSVEFVEAALAIEAAGADDGSDDASDDGGSESDGGSGSDGGFGEGSSGSSDDCP